MKQTHKVKTVALMTALAVLLLTACTGNQRQTPPGKPADVTQPMPGGTVTIAESDGAVSTIDPVEAGWNKTSHALNALGDPLVSLDPETGEIVPRAAESWTTDGRTFTFTLRDNLTFHDGRKATAADFKYSLERIIRLAKDRATPLYMLLPIKGAREYREGKAQDVAGIRAPDNRHLVIELEKPDVAFLAKMTYSPYVAVPRDVVEKAGDRFGRPGGVFVSTGPFKLESFTDDTLTMARNDTYWGPKPLVDRIRMIGIPKDKDLKEMLDSGEVDIAFGKVGELVTRPDLKDIRAKYMNDTVAPLGRSELFYFFNMKDPLIGGNKKLRQAIEWAIDRQAVLDEGYGGFGLPAPNLVPPNMPGFSSQPPMYGYDPDKAKRFLAEAGFPDGKGLPPIRLYISADPTELKIAEIVRRQLEKIGIRTTLLTIPLEKFPDYPADFQIAGGGWVGDYPDATTWLEPILASDPDIGTYNIGKHANAAVDSLLREASTTPDLARRAELLRQAERIAMEDAPVLPIFYTRTGGVRHPRVHGNVLNEFGMSTFDRIWIER